MKRLQELLIVIDSGCEGLRDMERREKGAGGERGVNTCWMTFLPNAGCRVNAITPLYVVWSTNRRTTSFRPSSITRAFHISSKRRPIPVSGSALPTSRPICCMATSSACLCWHTFFNGPNQISQYQSILQLDRAMAPPLSMWRCYLGGPSSCNLQG